MAGFIRIQKEDGTVEYIREDIENYPTINLEPSEHIANLTPEQIQEMIRSDKIRVIRDQRNTLLFASDWTQTLDAPLTADKKAEWAAYRQQLRDLPNYIIDVNSVAFPAKPRM
jgi:hypothetical protein